MDVFSWDKELISLVTPYGIINVVQTMEDINVNKCWLIICGILLHQPLCHFVPQQKIKIPINKICLKIT